MSEEKKVKRGRRRRRRKLNNAPIVEVNTTQMFFTAYPHLAGVIENYQTDNEISTRSAAIRRALEEFFDIDPDIVKEYEQNVKESRVRAGKITSRTVHARKEARKLMEKGKWYTKYELAQLTGVSRKTVGRMVAENYPTYFSVSEKKLPNGRNAELVRLKTPEEVKAIKEEVRASRKARTKKKRNK